MATQALTQAQWHRVADQVIEYGREHESCVDSMIEFTADATGIDYRVVEEYIRSKMKVKFKLTVEFEGEPTADGYSDWLTHTERETLKEYLSSVARIDNIEVTSDLDCALEVQS